MTWQDLWRQAVALLLDVPLDRVSLNEGYARSLLPRLGRAGTDVELADLLCRAAWVSVERADDPILDANRWPSGPGYRLPEKVTVLCEALVAAAAHQGA